MAIITKVNLEHIYNAVGTTVQSPIDIANNIKSYASSNGDTLDTAQMLVNTLRTLETFASAAAKYETAIPGVTLSSVTLGINLTKAYLELEIDDNGVAHGQIQNGTLNSIFADVSSLTADAGLAAKNPYVVGLGLTASVGFSTAALLSTEGDTSMANGIVEFASDTYNTYNNVTDSLSGTKAEFLDTVDYLYSASGLVQEQYHDSKDIFSNNSSSDVEFPSLSSWLKDNDTVIKVDSEEIVQYLDNIGVEKASLTIDNKTTTYTLDDTNSLTPEYQTDLSTNTVIPLQNGQTISHIATNTPYNSIELLDYNNLTLDQAKNLPVGFEVKVPKDISVVDGEYGSIKIYEGYDETGVIVTPNEKITYDENSDLLIYGDNDKITFTDTETGNYQEWSKDSNGSMFQSLESNNDLSISYEMIDGTKTVNDIEILSDNVNLEEIASYTSYTKEDLQAFNFLDTDTIDSNTNFQLPASKEADISGGYDDISHFTTEDGHDIFVVPQENGTSTTNGFNIEKKVA